MRKRSLIKRHAVLKYSLVKPGLLSSFRGEDEHVKLKDFLLTNSAVLHANHFLMTTCKWRLFRSASSIHERSNQPETVVYLPGRSPPQHLEKFLLVKGIFG